MLTITAPSWTCTASYADGVWACNDALLEKFLNNACNPASKDPTEALAMVRTQFTGVVEMTEADAPYDPTVGTSED